MTIEIQLTENELEQAVREYLASRRWGKVKRVRFASEGFADSPDPREQAVTFSAAVTVEAKS